MVRMPKYAKIQNRMGSKPQTPKPRPVRDFLNSSFGLWLLSATFLTIGGSLVSSRNECIASADSNIESYKRITTELFSRRLRIFDAADTSSNEIDFVRLAHSNAYANFKEFDGQSLYSLIKQHDAISQKIKFNFDIDDIFRRLSEIRIRPHNTTTIEGMVSGLTDFGPQQHITQVDLNSFRAYATDVLAIYYANFYLEGSSILRPDCSPVRLAARIFTADEQTAAEIQKDSVPDLLRLFFGDQSAPALGKVN